MRNRQAEGLRRHKYAVLLVMLLAALALQSLAISVGTEGLISDLVATALVVAIFLVVFDLSRARATKAAILIALLAIGWAHHLLDARFDYALSLAHQALLAVYLWVAIGVILRDLFRTPAVGAEHVLGAICGYLIAGGAWASVNEVTYLLAPAAYSIAPQVAPLLGDWHGRIALFSYYSFTQMLTIGYADVTPVRAPATTLSLFAALFGLFYTAVVVSQLVGMAQNRRPRNGDGA